jgi:hypothetical protein
MRLEGELFEVKRGMFYACLACVEGYKGSDGFIVVPMVRSNLREEGFSANSGWVIEKGLFNSVDPNFLIFGKIYQLPVYRVKSDRKLFLKSRGMNRIFTVGNSLGSLCITEINSVGELLVEKVNIPKILEKQASSVFINVISGEDVASVKFRDALMNKLGELRGKFSGDALGLSIVQNALTNADCSMLEPMGLNTCLVGFYECKTGVCQVLDRVDYVRISIYSMIKAGVRVLDLSRCTRLKEFTLTGGGSGGIITIIFNDALSYRMDSNIQISSAGVRFIGLRHIGILEADDCRIEGISEITFASPRDTIKSCCVNLHKCEGFDSLKINVGNTAFNLESSISISDIDAKEISIKMHEKKVEAEDFEIARCAELESLTIEGAGDWYFSDLVTKIRLLPKLKRASFGFDLFNINLLNNTRGTISNLSLGSTVLESLRICADYAMDEYSRSPEIWCDSRVKLDLPSELMELITIKRLTDAERFLLAFTCGTAALKRNGREIILDLEELRDWDGFDDNGWSMVTRNLSMYTKYEKVNGEPAIRIPKSIVSSVDSHSVTGWKSGTGYRVYFGDERLDNDW